MLGAIIGDIVGSAYEFNPTNDYDFELFKDGCSFTDDTICTVAVADALLYHKDYGESLHQWCRLFPNPKGSYGGQFHQWVKSDNPKPYNSLGNGSAMRVSPIAWAHTNLVSAMGEAEKSASCTHNHPEGIKGAEAVVMAIHFGDELRRLSPKIDREAILKAFEPILTYTHYNINIRRADVINKFDETCPGTVPVALWIISESTGFEDAIRKAVSLGADADTLGAIVGSIAEAIWGIPEELASKAMSYLPEVMKAVVNQFYHTYTSAPNPLSGNETEKTDDDEEINHDQVKAMMLWKLGFGHIGKYLAGEDPMPAKEKRAIMSDFDVEPMPKDDVSEVPMYYEISEEKMRILKLGHIPEAQEDHWLMICERNYIRYYRSWTGMCAFVAHFHKSKDKYIIDSLMINHRLDEFAVNGEEPAKALFLFLLSSETDGFNEGLWQAYLRAWEKQFEENFRHSIEQKQREKENDEDTVLKDDLCFDKKRRISPARIDRLQKNEVFVFGSNQFGHHHGGAAAAAMKKFGAVWGVGDGLQGQSYAISTMEGLIETAKNVNRFIRFAAEHQELRFYVTPIGCGIAGYNPLQIAPLFTKALALPNVYLPEIFWEYFWQTHEISMEDFKPSEDWKKWDKK